MKVRLSKNAFVRIIDNGDFGYINNQLTYQDRIYDSVGCEFLKQISRDSQEVNYIIDNLCSIFDAPKETIRRDFIKFISDLEKHGFVITGETEDEIISKDPQFTYDLDNPKTIGRSFSQQDSPESLTDTETFALNHDARKPRLTNIQFELTSRCNERCIHCYIPNAKKDCGTDMTFLQFKSILDQFAELGGYHVTLSGGEALLHQNIAEILRYCRAKDMQISLLTNLALLTDDLVPVLREVNLSIVQVSLYSMDASIHDYITRVKGSFEKTKRAIEKLREADIPLQISCPIMKANKIGYNRVLEYARSLKIKAQTDYIMMAQCDLGLDNLANRINLEETRQVIQDILDYDYHYHDLMSEVKPIKSLPQEEVETMPICGAGLNEICVAANGDVFPCAGWQSYVVGNIHTSTLFDIWYNSPKLKFIRKITNADFPECLKCPNSEYCSICLVRNYNESNGDMFKINNHFCKVAKLTKEMVEAAKGNVWLVPDKSSKDCGDKN